MKLSTIHKLCCPFDRASLKLNIVEQTIDNDVRIGSLICTNCKRFYPIVSGIPIMSPDEYRDEKIEARYYNYLLANQESEKIENFRLISS